MVSPLLQLKIWIAYKNLVLSLHRTITGSIGTNLPQKRQKQVIEMILVHVWGYGTLDFKGITNASVPYPHT